MKTFLTFLFAICMANTLVLSQDSLDVVRLKDGKTYRGTITRQTSGTSIEIKVGKNNVLAFEEDEIAKVYKEAINMPADSIDAYGGRFSMGAAIGGGGLLGVPFRFTLNKTSVFELGLFYRPFIINYGNDNYDIKGGLLLAGSLNLAMKKQYNPIKRKVVSNGLFVRGGIGLSEYKESILGFGWASERFRRGIKKYSFVSELGPGMVIRNWLDDPKLSTGLKNDKKVGFILVWKIHWNSYPR